MSPRELAEHVAIWLSGTAFIVIFAFALAYSTVPIQ